MNELAKRILEETDGKICSHCLGRKMSKAIEGNDNVDRALKISKELNIDLDNKGCVICGNVFDKIDDGLFQKIYDKIDLTVSMSDQE